MNAVFPPRRSPTRVLAWSSVGVVVAAEVVVAARTDPFTWGADLVTTIGMVGMVAALLVQRSGKAMPSGIARRPRPTDQVWGRRWTLWLVPLAAAGAWELFCYFAAPRPAHPTLSSMLGTLTSTPVGRGVAFALWLALGWYVVTR